MDGVIYDLVQGVKAVISLCCPLTVFGSHVSDRLHVNESPIRGSILPLSVLPAFTVGVKSLKGQFA